MLFTSQNIISRHYVSYTHNSKEWIHILPLSHLYTFDIHQKYKASKQHSSDNRPRHTCIHTRTHAHTNSNIKNDETISNSNNMLLGMTSWGHASECFRPQSDINGPFAIQYEDTVSYTASVSKLEW